MLIKTVVNNNVVMSTDQNGDECVLVGNGLGFKAHAGDNVDAAKVQKKFMLADKGILAKFKRILDEVSTDELLVSTEIISLAKRELKTNLNESIYITLPDHIHFVLQRYHEGKLMNNSFLWDIERYYPKEYQVATKAVEMINEKFSVELDDNEIGFLTFHFINAANDLDGTENTTQLTEIVHEIISIVSLSMNYPIDTKEINSYRFITHVKFFVQRMVKRIPSNDPPETDLFEIVRSKYQEAYIIVKKINQLLVVKYHYPMSQNDQLYFMMHIHRLQVHQTNE